MQTTSNRRTALALAALVALGASLSLSPAQAQAPTLTPSRISVHTSDATPASGQELVLSGAVWSQHLRVPAIVRIKVLRDGTWQRLPGAVRETDRHDRYRLRVSLQMPGERQLKVVGDPHDPTIANAASVLTVMVH